MERRGLVEVPGEERDPGGKWSQGDHCRESWNDGRPNVRPRTGHHPTSLPSPRGYGGNKTTRRIKTHHLLLIGRKFFFGGTASSSLRECHQTASADAHAEDCT